MLRINQNSHASGAKSYYSSSDYYVDGQELSGVWRGEGARKLGLTGDVTRTEWDSGFIGVRLAMCDGNLMPLEWRSMRRYSRTSSMRA